MSYLYYMLNNDKEIIQWLKIFEDCVQRLDYAQARSLFLPDCYCFGSQARKIVSLDDLVEDQWKQVWPNIKNFGFNYALLDCRISEAKDMASAICPWHSVGFHPDGRSFERGGRATIILGKDAPGGRWRAYHTHYSLNPGTPQNTLKQNSSASISVARFELR